MKLSQNKKNVLIIGLGQIGMMYDQKNNKEDFFLSHAKSFNAHPSFEVVGAVEPDPLKEIIFKEKYNKNVFKSIKESCKKLNPNLAVIASPTKFHYQHIEETLKYSSVEVILCEKPLSYDIKEARKMISLCKEHKVKLFINYVRRADPGVKDIKKMINQKKIDEPIKGFCWYTKGMIHTSSHFIDLLVFWLGDIKDYKLINKGDLLDTNDPEPDFLLTFEKGNVIFQSAWNSYFSHYTIELLSKSGRLQYDNEGRDIYWKSLRDDPDFPGYTTLENKTVNIESKMNIYQYNVTSMISDFFKGLDVPLTSGEEALKISEILNKIKNLI